MVWDFSKRAAQRAALALTLCSAGATGLMSLPAQGGEDPPGCNSEGVAVAIVTNANGQVIPPGGGVVPGQVVEYRAFVSVFENFPPFIFCDAIGGQLAITVPNWESIPAGGGPAVFGTQIVPVAGYGGTPAIPQFGNSSGSGLFKGANSAFYTVDPADADAGGFLNARADLGQTGFMTQIGLTQTNSTVLSDPEEIAQASVTTSIELLQPAIALEKSASISRLCLGETELVTYTMTVTNPGETSLTNVVVTDPDCDSAISGPSGDLNGNSILETTETWVYTCTRSVTATTSDPIVNTASVTSVAFNLGRAVLGVPYSDTADATIGVNPNPTVEVMGAAICAGDPPAKLCATISGGTAPYTVQWFFGGNPVGSPCLNVPAGGQCCFSAATAGTYTAVATDANGCIGSDSGELDVNPNRIVTVVDNTICESAGTGELCATVAGGQAPYTIVWTVQGGGPVAGGTCVNVGENEQCCITVPPGNYCATATDANGCIGTDCGTLSTVDDPTCLIEPENPEICDGDSVEICAVVSGGTAPFTYLWNTGDTTSCITVDAEGLYSVTVTDANNCTTSCETTVTVNENPTCTVQPEAPEICEGESVELCAVVTGGRTPYSYNWSTGATSECITVDTSGTYSVTVTDANGCQTSCETTVDVNENPTCTITAPPCENVICNTTGNTLTATVAGGRPPYTFVWSLTGPGWAITDGQGTATITYTAGDPNTIGMLMLTVTDDNGCENMCMAQLCCTEPPGGEGCTPGYWKQPHHFDDWTAPFDPTDLFDDHFENAFNGKTMLTVLSQPASASPGPNALNSLGRHTVAALLNAANPDVDFGFTVQQVIDAFNDVYPGSDADYLTLKNEFAEANEAGCPLNNSSDANNDGLVDVNDLNTVISHWGTAGPGDVTHDGIVNINDLLHVVSNFGL